jgi:hypothetical protein
LTSAEALNPELGDGVLKTVTRDGPGRNAVSWLEYWLYMCTDKPDDDMKFDERDYIASRNEGKAYWK